MRSAASLTLAAKARRRAQATAAAAAVVAVPAAGRAQPAAAAALPRRAPMALDSEEIHNMATGGQRQDSRMREGALTVAAAAAAAAAAAVVAAPMMADGSVVAARVASPPRPSLARRAYPSKPTGQLLAWGMAAAPALARNAAPAVAPRGGSRASAGRAATQPNLASASAAVSTRRAPDAIAPQLRAAGAGVGAAGRFAEAVAVASRATVRRRQMMTARVVRSSRCASARSSAAASSSPPAVRRPRRRPVRLLWHPPMRPS